MCPVELVLVVLLPVPVMLLLPVMVMLELEVIEAVLEVLLLSVPVVVEELEP